jgi:hypothetical protein
MQREGAGCGRSSKSQGGSVVIRGIVKGQKQTTFDYGEEA